MPRRQPTVTCSAEDFATLTKWSNNRTRCLARLVERARIVLGCVRGDAAKDIARDLGIRPNTVINWRRRFQSEGIAGPYDRPRPGKPKLNTNKFQDRVLETIARKPPSGQATWDGACLAARLGASDDAMWRVLRREGISLQRRRCRRVGTDPKFAAKAADVVGLYLNPPTPPGGFATSACWD